MIRIRKAADRGVSSYHWLDSHHTFSFDHFYDPEAMGFGPLRVINEDTVAPGAGFPTHGHRDMEIVTWVLDGALRHADSLENGSVIRPGDAQRMSAGTGIRHSEYNASSTDPVHFLQIWILPEMAGLPAGYEQKAFPVEERRSRLRLIGSRDGRDGSITIHQNVDLYASVLDEGAAVDHTLAADRFAWIQVARGSVTLNGLTLGEGDGAALDERAIRLVATSAEAEVLLFDMGS